MKAGGFYSVAAEEMDELVIKYLKARGTKAYILMNDNDGQLVSLYWSEQQCRDAFRKVVMAWLETVEEDSLRDFFEQTSVYWKPIGALTDDELDTICDAGDWLWEDRYYWKEVEIK